MGPKKEFPHNFDIDISPFHDLMKRMDSFFNDSFKLMDSHFKLRPFWVDMYESGNNIIVEADLVNYHKDQINLEIIGNQLLIQVEDNSIIEEKNDQTKHYLKEQSHGRIERVITLPFAIPEKETTAKFINGTLKVTIPKKDPYRKYIDID